MTPQKFTGGVFKNRSLKMEKWSLKSNSQQNIIQIFRKSYSMFLHLQKIWQHSSLALSSCFAVPSTYPKVLSSYLEARIRWSTLSLGKCQNLHRNIIVSCPCPCSRRLARLWGWIFSWVCISSLQLWPSRKGQKGQTEMN